MRVGHDDDYLRRDEWQRQDDEDNEFVMAVIANRDENGNQNDNRNSRGKDGGTLGLFFWVFVAFAAWIWLPDIANQLNGNTAPVAALGPAERKSGRATENAVKEALLGLMKPSGHTQKNGKGMKTPAPLASKVEKGDHIRLPLTGTYRFPVPKGTALKDLEIGSNGGYLDRFGSEWIPYRVNDRIVAWRSNLSERGQLRMGWAADERDFVLIGRDGKKIKV